ncbi:MAG: hypothetical protein H7Z43_08855 [Clostridia bacterium]|nr:hypothetical protein [Deltaproteobacteria bacterium]
MLDALHLWIGEASLAEDLGSDEGDYREALRALGALNSLVLVALGWRPGRETWIK